MRKINQTKNGCCFCTFLLCFCDNKSDPLIHDGCQCASVNCLKWLCVLFHYCFVVCFKKQSFENGLVSSDCSYKPSFSYFSRKNKHFPWQKIGKKIHKTQFLKVQHFKNTQLIIAALIHFAYSNTLCLIEEHFCIWIAKKHIVTVQIWNWIKLKIKSITETSSSVSPLVWFYCDCTVALKLKPFKHNFRRRDISQNTAKLKKCDISQNKTKSVCLKSVSCRSASLQHTVAFWRRIKMSSCLSDRLFWSAFI